MVCLLALSLLVNVILSYQLYTGEPYVMARFKQDISTCGQMTENLELENEQLRDERDSFERIYESCRQHADKLENEIEQLWGDKS